MILCPMSNPSQCSTVVRNTVVRATIKVNGKPQIFGTQTPESVKLKFDLAQRKANMALGIPNTRLFWTPCLQVT